jgi:hypothetical protein
MKDILISFASPVFGNNEIFADNEACDLNSPFRLLKKYMSGAGYNLKTVDQNDVKDCAWIIFINEDSTGEKIQDFSQKIRSFFKKNNPTRKLYKECLEAGLFDRTALFIWEGRSVDPRNYSNEVHKKFPIIFTWDDDLVDNIKYFKFYLPWTNRKTSIDHLNFVNKKLLVNISANKYSLSQNELYSARRKSIYYFDQYYPNDFDLFGPGWNKPATRLQRYLPWIVKKYSTYRGITEDKIRTLSQYKFTLCYENMSDTKGYVTEKIFDAFNAKVVPIYWGASNIEKYVDTNSFIDRRKFKNDDELAKFITKMSEDDYNKYIFSGKKYLESKEFINFLPESFCENIIKVLKLKS